MPFDDDDKPVFHDKSDQLHHTMCSEYRYTHTHDLLDFLPKRLVAKYHRLIVNILEQYMLSRFSLEAKLRHKRFTQEYREQLYQYKYHNDTQYNAVDSRDEFWSSFTEKLQHSQCASTSI